MSGRRKDWDGGRHDADGGLLLSTSPARERRRRGAEKAGRRRRSPLRAAGADALALDSRAPPRQSVASLLHLGMIELAKPELGVKRTCQACGAKYYDLMRDPIVCPKCGATFVATVILSSAAAARAAKADAARARKAAAEEEDDVEEKVEVDEDVEAISLEDADEEVAPEKSVVRVVRPDADEDEDDVVVDDDDDDDDADETFLEPDEDSDDDVTDIIGDREKDDDT
jgi:uncharacterized protein (TIGR02300 family)